LPHQLAVGGAHGDGGLAEGVEGAAGLFHLAGVLHVGGDAGEHFGRADRLGDVVGAAGGKGGDDVLGFGQPGHEDDGDVLGERKSAFSRRATSKPSMPGINASSRMTSGRLCRARCRADSPLVATSTV
jgi:hypothetical protein